MSRKWLAGLAGLLLAAIAVGVWETQFDEQRPIDPAPLNKYRETFVAKYRREECLVRIDFTYESEWSDKLRERVFRNLVRFIAEERPQTGLTQRLDRFSFRLRTTALVVTTTCGTGQPASPGDMTTRASPSAMTISSPDRTR